MTTGVVLPYWPDQPPAEALEVAAVADELAEHVVEGGGQGLVLGREVDVEGGGRHARPLGHQVGAEPTGLGEHGPGGVGQGPVCPLGLASDGDGDGPGGVSHASILRESQVNVQFLWTESEHGSRF